MRVTILHQTVDRHASAEEKDVLYQAASVREALERLGHDVSLLACCLDLEQLRNRLLRAPPDCVFYLVESLGGTDALAHLAAAMLESMGIPHTGAPAAALVMSNNKPRAKRLMAAAGLPTPPWVEADRRSADLRPDFPGTFILKPTDEHASLGMTDDAVVHADDDRQLDGHLRRRAGRLERPCFAEQFVEGREFNLAVLGTADGPLVLPPAEISFAAFPEGKPRIVGFDAKWSCGSYEYENTPRHFPCAASAEEAALGRLLSGLAVSCWEVFDLRGYARIDFRVDTEGAPWILEVNGNPCLAPDAGFAAALAEAGIPFDRAVASILADTPSL